MKPSALIAVFVLLSAVTLSAAEPPERFNISLFGNNVGYGWTEEHGGTWSGGPGIAAGYSFTPRWSVSIAVSSEEHKLLLTRFTPFVIDGRQAWAPETFIEKHRTYPIDLTTRYAFTNDSRWTPYAGLGIHHVTAPDTHVSGIVIPVIDSPQVVRETKYSDVNDAEVIVGFAFRLSRHLDLEAGASRLLTHTRPQNAFDPLTRTTIGLRWRF